MAIARPTMPELHREILRRLAISPATLGPLGFMIMVAAAAMAMKLGVFALASAAAGAVAAAAGGILTLALRGTMLRDQILARLESEAEENDRVTRRNLRGEFMVTAGSRDLLDLLTRYEWGLTELKEGIRSEHSPALARDYLAPIAIENHRTALRLFQRLVYIQKRITSLRRHRMGARFFRDKLRRLQRQREELTSHLTETVESMEAIADELMKLKSDQAEDSRRQLEELNRQLRLMRRAQETLQAETQPVSGIHELPSW